MTHAVPPSLATSFDGAAALALARRAIVLAVVVSAAQALPACAPAAAPLDAPRAGDAPPGADTPLAPGVTVSPDGEGFCCPRGAPSCDCTPTGGFSITGACPSWGVCDAAPSAFTPTTDEHGCPTYDVGPASCLGRIDAPGDAGVAAQPDARDPDAMSAEPDAP